MAGLLNPIQIQNIEEWRKKILSLSNWHFFYLPDWYYAFENFYKIPVFYQFETKKGYAFFPALVVKLPFIKREVHSAPMGGYGGIIGRADMESFERILLWLLVQYPDFKFFITLPSNFENQILNFLKFGFKFFKIPIYKLDLGKDKKEIFKGFSSMRRRNIKKAYEYGLEVVQSNARTGEYLKIYKRWLNQREVKWKVKERILIRLASSQYVRIFLVLKGRQPLAGAIILLGKEEAFYWHGVSDKEFLHLKPNDLLHWEIIKWLMENGYKTYNLGSSMGIEGVEKFKKGFGAKLLNHYLLVKK